MRFFKKKEKKIPDNKYRIIKIGKEALFEFLYESIIDNQKCFFDITDETSIVTHFDMDWEKGEFICIARNEQAENEFLQCDIDTEKLLSKLKNTTDSLYTENIYIELSKDDINNL
ncbi:MAG: hypothetical protein NC122_08465 [Faecalibacterium sp.]|nr:hypothetical protein [Ruminococcus sp.]MCM1391139.1 hypothetical protein [Ruminococcus sp.]MCM1486227.1 hypothetical protein [Faecalibacterium sp.]